MVRASGFERRLADAFHGSRQRLLKGVLRMRFMARASGS
jgi:hypothetical protein